MLCVCTSTGSGQLMKTLGLEIWLKFICVKLERVEKVVQLQKAGIDINEPNRVKTDTCPRKFRKVLKIIRRSLTPMISNHIHIHNQNTRFRSIADCFYCIVVEEIEIFFNLSSIIYTSCKNIQYIKKKSMPY